MKHFILSTLFLVLSTSFISADESLALQASRADLESIKNRIEVAKKEGADETTLKKLENLKYDREREIHHWELLIDLHNKKN